MLENTPTLYEHGRLTPVRPPYPALETSLRLTDDGARVVGLLSDDQTQQLYLWQHGLVDGSDRVAQLALPPLTGGMLWSPDARRFATFPDPQLAENPVVIADLDGRIERATVPGERIWWGVWRGPSELTLVSFTGPRLQRTQQVRIWTWTLGSSPRRLAETTISVPTFKWSPDNARLLYIGFASDGHTPAVRALDLNTGADEVIFDAASVRASDGGCVLAGGDVHLTDASWSPDGRRVAVAGSTPAQDAWFVALSGRTPPALFLLPASCYATFTEWMSDAVVVPMYGPECGPTNLENRVAVLDPSSAVARADILIGRKAFVARTARGDAFVTFRDGQTEFVPLRDPSARIRVPSTHFVGGCCT